MHNRVKRVICILLTWAILIEPILFAAVRGHASMYVGGTLTAYKVGDKGRLEASNSGLVFTPDKGTSTTIPYDAITAMDYGEHVGRRVGVAIATGTIAFLSHKKRHYLTIYLNNDPKVAAEQRAELAKDPKASPKGDVAAFEVNKHDYATLMSVLQAKTGLTVRMEEVKR
ncbi:MAG: hypothetical protein ABSA41_17075 [Terriglobia bacterium]|jgi:hypothetical protein